MREPMDVHQLQDAICRVLATSDDLPSMPVPRAWCELTEWRESSFDDDELREGQPEDDVTNFEWTCSLRIRPTMAVAHIFYNTGGEGGWEVYDPERLDRDEDAVMASGTFEWDRGQPEKLEVAKKLCAAAWADWTRAAPMALLRRKDSEDVFYDYLYGEVDESAMKVALVQEVLRLRELLGLPDVWTEVANLDVPSEKE